MNKLTTICAALALLGGAVGCGGTSTTRTSATTTKPRLSAISGSSGIPSFWNADTRAHCTTAEYGSGWCRASVTRQCNATPENQEEKELSEAACDVLREVPEASTQHTPAEEEKRKDNLGAEEKAAHEEEALENSSGGKKACEEEKRTQEKLHYESPNSSPEPQREAEYEQLCGH
jgi:hypothetical protein